MKTTCGISVIVIFGVLFAGAENDIRLKYLGQSNCLPELKSADHYGIRLDKSQMAYLDAYQWKGKNILAIVQHNHGDESCGTIRDVIQSRNPRSSFIFECSDNTSDVVVGTWPETRRSTRGLAVEAWKIDLKDLKFVPIKAPVHCINQDYSGNDEGEDLVMWARKRAAKRSSTPNR